MGRLGRGFSSPKIGHKSEGFGIVETSGSAPSRAGDEIGWLPPGQAALPPGLDVADERAEGRVVSEVVDQTVVDASEPPKPFVASLGDGFVQDAFTLLSVRLPVFRDGHRDAPRVTKFDHVGDARVTEPPEDEAGEVRVEHVSEARRDEPCKLGTVYGPDGDGHEIRSGALPERVHLDLVMPDSDGATLGVVPPDFGSIERIVEDDTPGRVLISLIVNGGESSTRRKEFLQLIDPGRQRDEEVPGTVGGFLRHCSWSGQPSWCRA